MPSIFSHIGAFMNEVAAVCVSATKDVERAKSENASV